MVRPWERFFPPGAAGRYPPPGTTLTEFVLRAPPHRTAVVDGEQTHSYGELGTAMSRAAAALERRGVRAGDRVLVRLPNSIDFILAVHAAFLLDCIAVPVPPLPETPKSSGS